MAKARGITKRRKAVQNIRKITRTMQLIATARFQRAFNRAVATRPYTNKLTELVRDLAATQEQIEHPLLQVNSGTGRSILLVLTSNRGLCGGYNAGLLRAAAGFLRLREQSGEATGQAPHVVELQV
ncbi:MAG TPA: FoF1 ATP synthase subunit gamma, partial [Phycisphaerae bacterium]|nr:FoF1 ATP synthase subunit gamma [Phycisphaerae bacterium]